jgi:putative ABC transport system permease protein
MFRPRWRKVLHDLTDNRARTLLVVFSVAVGVFAVGVIGGTYVIISQDMSASYGAGNPANIELRTSPFDQEMVDSVAGLRGVAESEGRSFLTPRMRSGPDRPWSTINVVALRNYEEQRINRLRPISGSPTPGRKEIVLERETAAELGIGTGDTLQIELADGTLRELPVVGVVQDPATGAGDFLAASLAFIDTDTLEYLHQPVSFNRLYVVASEGGDDPDHLRQLADDVTDRLEKNGVVVGRTQTQESAKHPMSSMVQAILGILGALGILVLFLSGSLIANTLNALLTQHLRHIGVIKLLGGRPAQVVAMYLALITAYCVLALLLAVPLGAQGAYALSAYVAGKMNFGLQGYRIVTEAVAVQIVVGLAIPLLVGLAPVLKGSRITVQRALSSDAAPEPEESPRRRGETRWEQLRDRWQAWQARGNRRSLHLPRPLLLSLRNTFRRKGRLALTLFTLTMGGAIFIAVFNVQVTLNDYIDQISRYFLADVTLEFERPYRLGKVRQDALSIPGVVDAEGWAFAAAELLDEQDALVENLVILAPPVDSPLVSPTMMSGRWLEPGDHKAIAISEGILDRLPNLQPGQYVRLKVDGKEDSWLVTGIFEFTSQQGEIAYATYETISGLTGMTDRSASYRIVAAQHDAAYQEALSDQLDRTFRDRGYQVREAQTGSSTMREASEGLDILVAFLLIMALLTAAVGSMGLAGTMSMNVLERTRELGIMRSIGAGDREVISTVMVEGLTIGGISFVLSVLLSFPITYLLTAILSRAVFQSPIDVSFTFSGFGLWLLVVLGLSALASLLPARNAARLTIREVLAYE